MGVNRTMGIQPPNQIHRGSTKTNLQMSIKNSTNTHEHTEQSVPGFDTNGFFRTCKVWEGNHQGICSVNSRSFFIEKINIRRLSTIIDSTI